MSAPAYSLVNLRTPQGERAALQLAGGCVRLDLLDGPQHAASLRALLDDWPALAASLPALAARALELGSDAPGFVPIEQALLTTPVHFPNKLVCVGAVYRDHLREFDLPAERWPKMPMFMRPPTTSLIGPGGSVAIPPNTLQFDWEVELAVVLGTRLTDGDLASARAAIAGYTVGIDLTCRDLLDRHAAAGVDLVRAKSQDQMAPCGPALVPAALIDDPQRLGMRLWVNDELKQDGHTSDMLFSVDEQIATISRYITLEPGDIVFTGSCAGSGASTGQFLRPGDRVRAEIENVGRLEVTMAPPRARPAGFREQLIDP